MKEQQQTQLYISIEKIFNWTQHQLTNTFQLQFISSKTQHLIVKKAFKGLYSDNIMYLNSFLKIKYTPQQNHVLLRLILVYHNQRDILGEFDIDLDILAQKAIQYFPFGSKDKVLQINKVKNLIYPNYQQQDKIKWQAEQNLKNSHLRQMHFDRMTIQKRDKKSFSEKVYRLLKQVKTIRQSREQQSNTQSKIKKAKSEFNYISQKATPQTSPISENKINKNLHNRLLLDSLSIVPCDEYYHTQHKQCRPSEFKY